VDGDNRTLCQDVELIVGNNGRDLNDHIMLWIQTRHFKIYPDQLIGCWHGARSFRKVFYAV